MYAARGNHVAVLQWARAQDCPSDESTCVGAAVGGHLELLQWLLEQGFPWDEETCSYAARGNHVAVLQWARAQDCPSDESTCVGAAVGGHLELLQWLLEQGCPWDEWTCATAALADQQKARCSGRGSATAPGIRIPVVWRRTRELCTAAVGKSAWLPLGRGHLRAGSHSWAPGSAAVGTGAKLFLE
mmetsp:Transcript_25772/g.64857  ORF Transcript_25772/g.64857 Transcript_25772/m.64857 type:complete len:186 (+) Transcript_25772:1023-1580(+)